jgi:HEAT repeat protein
VRTATLAARVLGRLGREGVSIPDRAELREALGAADPALRHSAALALGDLRDGEAVAMLVILAGKDKSLEVRAAARMAVSRILAAPGMVPVEEAPLDPLRPPA